MKVSGFTIVRNAVKFDYPAKEAILSILPLCDEFIVAVGNCEDNTREYILSINSPKIKIIDTVWDDTLREGGKVLADETNKALKAVAKDSDWAFYIQADEAVHENDHAEILEGMRKWKDDLSVEALVFNYHHFYGSYDYTGDSRRWYRREIRIIRPHTGIFSYRDAQGFRKGNDQKLNAKLLNASIHHYGWVKHPRFQQLKQESFHKMWHDDEWMKKNVNAVEEFDYSQIDSLKRFQGTHPAVMKERIEKVNWNFNFDPSKNKKPGLKYRFLSSIEKLTGKRIGEFRNYILK